MGIILSFFGLLALFVAFSFVRREIDPKYRRETEERFGIDRDKDGPNNA